MHPKLLEFLIRHRIAAVALILNNGKSHSAVMHFSFEENPLRLFFQTSKKSGKIAQADIMDGASAIASLCIGFSEEEWQTLQMEGKIRGVFTTEEKKKVQAIHYLRYPNSQENENDPDTLFLEFISSWWQLSDYNTNPPKKISSED